MAKLGKHPTHVLGFQSYGALITTLLAVRPDLAKEFYDHLADYLLKESLKEKERKRQQLSSELFRLALATRALATAQLTLLYNDPDYEHIPHEAMFVEDPRLSSKDVAEWAVQQLRYDILSKVYEGIKNGYEKRNSEQIEIPGTTWYLARDAAAKADMHAAKVWEICAPYTEH